MNWILCLCRNGLHLTKKAVASFKAQDIAVNILIIDNDSNDGTSQWLQTQDLTVSFQRPPLSVAESWNHGLQYIFKKHTRCLVVNNDVELLPQTYSTLLQDGGPFVTAVGQNKPIKDFTWNREVFQARPHPDFSCFMIRRNAYYKIGPFDEKFKGAYCEDSDYHCRMHKLGIDAHCINLPFYHHASGTIKNADKEEVKRIQRHADSNREYFQKKWGFTVGSPEYEAYFNTSKEMILVPPTVGR